MALSDSSAPPPSTLPSSTLLYLRRRIRSCTRCELNGQVTSPVPWSGGSPRDIAVLGEAPGRQEDSAGAPFVGPAGKLLRSALDAAAIGSDNVAYINTVSCWPKGTPTSAHVSACRLNLLDQIAAVQPHLLIPVGKVALAALCPGIEIRHVHGTPMYLTEKELGRRIWWANGVYVWNTYHPAAALRNKHYKQVMEQDLAAAKRWWDDERPWGETCYRCDREVVEWGRFGLGRCGRHGGKEG